MTLLPAALAGEKLRIRIWETAEKSFIGFARPWLIKREGSARAAAEYQNKMALGQAEADLEEVKAGRVRYDPIAGKLVPLVRPLPAQPQLNALPSPSSSTAQVTEGVSRSIQRLGSALDFATHTLHQSTVKEMERTINLEKILQKAEAEAEGVPDSAVSDSGPDMDWMARWRESAQDVTAEQVQLMWARVLAEEVKRPGSFSLRTLDFIRLVSAQEVALIERISPLVIGNTFVFRDDALLMKYGFVLHDLLTLESIGVISGVGRLLQWKLRVRKPEEGAGGLRCYDLGIMWKSARKEVQVPCYVVTQLGRELLGVGQYKGKPDYLRAVADHIGKHGVRCALGAVNMIGQDAFRVEEEDWFGPTDIEEAPAAGV